MSHRRISCLAVAFIAATVFAGAAKAEDAKPADVKVVATFAIGGDGKWDYITVDADAQRLYIARATRVMVVDAEKGTLLGEVADTPGVHGVALVPDRNEGYASNGTDGTVSVFDLKTFKTIRKIKAGEKPDAIIYDPASKCVLAFNGKSGDVTIIDPAAPDKAPQTLAVGGKLEAGVSDGAGKVYLNVEDKSQTVVIDTKQWKVTDRWSVAPGDAPTGLAIDAARHRLYVGCSNSKVVVLDAEKGSVLATIAAGAGIDGVAFDTVLGAVSANGKDGTATIVREADGKFTAAQTVETVKTAKTIGVDTKNHKTFSPCTITAPDGSKKFGVVVVGVAPPAGTGR